MVRIHGGSRRCRWVEGGRVAGGQASLRCSAVRVSIRPVGGLQCIYGAHTVKAPVGQGVLTYRPGWSTVDSGIA